jgi:hypothetical protein
VDNLVLFFPLYPFFSRRIVVCIFLSLSCISSSFWINTKSNNTCNPFSWRFHLNLFKAFFNKYYRYVNFSACVSSRSVPALNRSLCQYATSISDLEKEKTQTRPRGFYIPNIIHFFIDSWFQFHMYIHWLSFEVAAVFFLYTIKGKRHRHSFATPNSNYLPTRIPQIYNSLVYILFTPLKQPRQLL